jgi:hypothetical protein
MVSSRNDMLVEFLQGILTRSINLPLGFPYEVSYIGENIVAVTIWDKHEVVFVNVITNTIINTIYVGHECWGTDFNMYETSYGIPVNWTMSFS